MEDEQTDPEPTGFVKFFWHGSAIAVSALCWGRRGLSATPSDAPLSYRDLAFFAVAAFFAFAGAFFDLLALL